MSTIGSELWRIFGVYHAHPGVSLTAAAFGPRFSFRQLGRFIPFTQLLIGGQHASAVTTGFTDASNAFTLGAGGGFDIGLDSRGRFALRPQMEYFGFRANSIATTAAYRWASCLASGKKDKAKTGGGK